MATGRCTNIMRRCSKALSKEIQEADKANFICSECGKPLTEVNGGVPPIGPGGGGKPGHTHTEESWLKKHMKLIIMLIVLIAILIGAYFLLRGGSEESANSPSNITLSKNTGELAVGDKDTLQAILNPENAEAQLKWATSDTTVIKVVDGIVTAVSPGNAKVGVQVLENKTLKAFCEYTVTKKKVTDGDGPQTDGLQDKSRSGSVLGGAATISGNTITFRHAYTLDLKTMEGEELSIERGDKIREAKIENGCLTSGIYVSSTGEERYISGLNVELQ